MNLNNTLFAFRTTFPILLLTFCCFSDCSRLKNKTDQKASEDIVLKIGDFEITRYEFEKQNNNQNKSNKIVEKNWLNQYLHNSYFVADAYQKKYDTCSIVQLRNYFAQLHLCSSVGQYYWNKTEEPKLQITDAELRSAYKKRNKLFYLDYFVFADKSSMLHTLTDTILENVNEFSKMALACRGKNNVSIVSEPLVWPFKHLADFKETIYKLKPGEITGPLYGPRYVFIVKLNRIELQKLPPFQDVKEEIKKELKSNKTDYIVDRKQKEILAHACYQINESALDEVLSEIKKINQTQFDTTRLSIINNNVLATFKLGNDKQQLTIGDFLNYYHFYPFIKTVIKDKKGIYSAVEFLVLQRSIYEEARQLGVLKEKGFLLETKMLTDQYVEDAYYKNEIENCINITESELDEQYQRTRQEFEQVGECSVYLFKFADKQSLESSWKYLSGQFAQGNLSILTDDANVKGLLAYFPDLKIKRNDKRYPPKLINAIFSQPINQLSPPYLDFDGIYYAFYKMKESEKTIQPFEVVRDILYNQVRMMKIHQLEEMRVQKLEQEYSLTINKIKNI
ncbi:MAG TPA: peptidyl-prolyl cis-trans isomerase [Bacteroidales bacterium]|nr:peptidyl-prolyl cis-trans isomerase [Bacteroidales bacterium]